MSPCVVKLQFCARMKKCSSEINREDQFRHQGEECKFRKENCCSCKEMGSVVQKIGTSLDGLSEHVEKLNNSVNEMKNRSDGNWKKV